MNTLIKEFEKKCWNHQTNQVDTELFTKLIVDKCCKEISSIAQVHPKDIYDEAERNAIGEAIMRMKHVFGLNK